MSTSKAGGETYWPAPTPSGPINATVALPGSKSQTSRAFVIGSIAQNPTTIAGALASRDTYLAAKAMVAGAEFLFEGDPASLTIDRNQCGGATIDCGGQAAPS